MRTIRTIAAMRAWTAERRAAGDGVALVPTMGAFHAGHLALMRAARTDGDAVVVSLFVNPAQFDDDADLAAYPRDEAADAARAAAEGVAALFAPAPAEMYPDGFATTIRPGPAATGLEGASRGPRHFEGVCTIVAKLLNVVAPDRAWFGEKDAQQLAVLRRMVADLDVPVELRAHPTVRDADGLALSSRNARLAPAERARATALHAGLEAAAAALAGGERAAAALTGRAAAVMRERGVEPEYVALVDPDRFAPIETARGRVRIVVAARIGAVRLIDNQILDVPPPAATG